MSSIRNVNQSNSQIALQQLFSKLQIDHFIQISQIKDIFDNDKIMNSIVNLLSVVYNNLLGSKSIDERQKYQAQLSSNNHYLMVQKILPILAQHVSYPQPAICLANFQYEKFRIYCENSGNENLLRHSKGLMPFINCDSSLIPLFVPYHQQLGYLCYGNQSWREARSILNMRFESTKSLGQEIKLCYKILLGRPQLTDFGRENCWNKIWAQLYTYYLVEGLQKLEKYANSEISNQQIKNAHLNVFSPLEFKYEPQLNNFLDKNKIGQYLVLLLIKSILLNDPQYIKKLLEMMSFQQLGFQQMVISALLFKIFQLTDSVENSGFLYNKFLNYLTQKEYFHDHFMKIFFSDQQIMKYYTNQREIDLPSVKFGDQVMRKIGERLIIEKPQLIADVINYLQGQFKLIKLLQSQQLATQNLGLELIQILKNNHESFGMILRNSLNEYGVTKDLEHFILSWEAFHRTIYARQHTNQKQLLFLIQSGHTYIKGFDSTANSPLKNPKNVYLILRKYAQLISQKLHNQQKVSSKMLSLVFTRQVKELMSKLKSKENDELWSLFSSILLRDETYIEELMNAR